MTDKKIKNFVGVDPGSNPAICILDSKGDIITISYMKSKEYFPYKEYGEFCQKNLKSYDVVFVEDVHSVFNSSAKANFSFGRGVGASSQGVWFLDYYNMVQPKEWQKLLWTKEDKSHGVKGGEGNKMTSLNCAKRILGDKWKDELFLPTKKSYKVNHNMIDAYLVALYGYRTFKH